jgi:hypothetical protein
MKKIVIASIVSVMLPGVAIAADSGQTRDAIFGIECVRWSNDATQIICGAHPWRRNDPAEITFSSVKDIYERGYRVISMYNIEGVSGRTVFVIEKQK